MRYPTINNVKAIIARLNKRYNMGIVIINKGQLEFALEKPKMKIYNNEQYRDLYQKSAVLMETLIKSHALSDGNKRCAMMVAEYMIKINGAELVLPLKAIRLSVDAARDDNDTMTDEIQQWFKVHVAENINQLSIMLREHVEEESIIESLLEQKKYQEADMLMDKWMVFDTYPEHKIAYKQLVDRWKKKKLDKNADPYKSHIWPIIQQINQDYTGYPFRNDIITKIEDLNIIGHTLGELKKYEKKIQHDEEILANASSLEDLYFAGFILNKFSRTEKARCMYDRIIRKKPSESRAYYYRGMSYSKSGEHEKAITDFQKCAKLGGRKEIWRASVSIANELFYLRKYNDAIKQCDKNIQDCPKDSISYWIKGKCLAEKGSLDEAEQVMKKAARLYPDESQYKTGLGIIHSRRGDWEEAIKYHEQAVAMEPKSAVAKFNLATAYSKRGQTDKAKKNFQMALEAEPDNIHILINYGALLSNNKESDEAIKFFDKVLEIEPGQEGALENIGVSYAQLGNYEKAIIYWEKAARLYPKNTNVSYNMAKILMIQNDIDGALTWIERTIKEDSNMKKRFLEDSAFSSLKNSELFKKGLV